MPTHSVQDYLKAIYVLQSYGREAWWAGSPPCTSPAC
jgi:hypothetical protein